MIEMLDFYIALNFFFSPDLSMLAKKPLKKIEKPAGASTCVLVNQYCNGQIGTLKPNPKKINKYKYQTSSKVNLKLRKTKNDELPVVYTM